MNISLSPEDWQAITRALSERASALSASMAASPELGFNQLRDQCLNIERKITVRTSSMYDPVQTALDCLNSDHVRQNQCRMGALGSDDVDMARSTLERALQP